MSRKHYHVITGLSGLYMPNDVYTTTSQRNAEQYATEQKRRFNDDILLTDDKEYIHDKTYIGNIHTDQFYQTRDGNEEIAIHECYDDECQLEDDNDQ